MTAWGTKVATPIPAPRGLSFQEIVDEELARKYSDNSVDQQQNASEDLSFEEQLALALQLSEQENISNNNSLPVENNEKKTDNDYLIALQLQSEYNSEYSEEKVKQLNRLQGNTISKVAYSLDLALESSLVDEELEEEDDEDDEEEDEYENENPQGQKPHHEVSKTNGRQTKEIITKHDPLLAGIKNSEYLIERGAHSGNLVNISIATPVFNSIREEQKRSTAYENRVRGNRLDKSTSEHVLDQRTRVILLKMLNAGVLGQLNGIVSTGKEANVYHAIAGSAEPSIEGREFAVKIFKTTLNEFKNRSNYVEGDFRFRHQTNNQNPRKLIKLWAEKETRNYKRLTSAGILCPRPIYLRENVLITEFLGKDGWASPRLVDAKLSLEKLKQSYRDCVKVMRDMFYKCKLIHADLSEYNILWHKNQIWIIDVSQSVEYDHPNSLHFLRNDCNCITQFFTKKGVDTMSALDLFTFITDKNLEDSQVDNVITQLISKPQTQSEIDKEKVFQQTFIPRHLKDVPNAIGEIFDNQTAFHLPLNGLSSVQNDQDPHHQHPVNQ